MNDIPRSWLLLGFLGQMLFSARFVLQWIASERKRASVVPIAFWWLSIGGGSVLLSYAILQRDPVFILGQGMGLLVYVRNLILIRRERIHRRPQPEALPEVLPEAQPEGTTRSSSAGGFGA